LKTKISIILLFISLALLVIYGADVISSKIASNDGKSGFLQLNDAIRGGVFGGGAVILSIIAFVISLKETSTLVSVLLFINGGLIIAGMIGLAVQGMVQEGARNNSTLLGTTGLGILLIALGIAKIIITRKK
jgi:quinol-cytochrome oxidoreductase complex cytochrome b subunit